jgi:hypothetical protein
MGGRELNSPVSGYEVAPGSCKHGNDVMTHREGTGHIKRTDSLTAADEFPLQGF